MARRPYQRDAAPRPDRLRREWVSLDNGDVCVWELTAAEMGVMSERSTRPAIDPRGGIDTTGASAWMAALSCRQDDAPGSPRIWDDLAVSEILALRFEEWARLQETMQRLNGLDAESVEERRDFTPATGAPKASGSNGSASKNSTGSRPKSTSPTTS
jgi:hypothetical protein